MATNQPAKVQAETPKRKRVQRTPEEKLRAKCARSLEDIAGAYRDAASALRKGDHANYNASLGLTESYQAIFATMHGKLRDATKTEEPTTPTE